MNWPFRHGSSFLAFVATSLLVPAACGGSGSGSGGSGSPESTGSGAGAESGNGSGTAYGCSNADGTVDFVVTSNQPEGNTAVLSYPAMQDNFDAKPLLSSFHAITATFEETSPHVGDYEVAWDCWFNDNANEFMVWVDDYNQVPGGNQVASNVPLGGRSYDVWWAPGTGTGGYVVFSATKAITSGTVDLLQLFEYGVSNGWLPADSKVDQLSFGVEVCSTGGKDATWTVSDYAITTN
jgi:glycosyl hydrolase family 12